LIKVFDINFYLNRSNSVHNTFVNNWLIESLLLKFTKSSVRRSLDVFLRISIIVWIIRGFETHFVSCYVATVGSSQLLVQPASWLDTHCRLSTTACLVLWKLVSVSVGRLFPQPKDTLWRDLYPLHVAYIEDRRGSHCVLVRKLYGKNTTYKI